MSNNKPTMATPALGDPSQKPQFDESLLPERIRQELADNLRVGKELLNEINDNLAKRNIISEYEFSKFIPLYRDSLAATGLSPEQFRVLSVEYQHRFDPYAPIKITDAQGKIKGTIHALFKQLTAISDDRTQSHVRFYQDGSDPLAAYSKPAADNLAVSIIQAQKYDKTELINEKLETTKSIIDMFNRSGRTVTQLSIDGRPISGTSEINPTLSQNNILDNIDEYEPD